MTSRQEAVLRALPGTAETIAAETGLKSVRTTLRAMERAGIVFSDGPFWLLTAQGRIAVMSRGPKLPWLEGAECGDCPLYGAPPVPASLPEGGCDVLMVGEAPGETEVNKQIPFCGKSGQLLRSMIRSVGLDQGRVGYTNVVSCRPQGNADPDARAVRLCSGRLRRDVERANPKLVLALGRFSAAAVGAGRLTSRHGMPAEGTGPAEGRRVVGTYHPAAVLRNPVLEPLVRADLGRAKELLTGRVLLPPDPPIHHCSPSELVNVLPNGLLACDIETDALLPPANILSVALSDGERAWVCHLAPISGWESDLGRALHNRPVLWQNGKFDALHLRHHGIHAQVAEDTFLMAHAINELGEHGLEYLVGQYLHVYGYKAEALHGSVGKSSLLNVDRDTLLRYNALDAYYTHRLWGVMREALDHEGTRPAYELMVRGVAPLMDMEYHGVMIDTAALADEERKLERRRVEDTDRFFSYLRQGGAEEGVTVPEGVNPNSSTALAKLLTDMRVLHPDKHGKVSTGAASLTAVKNMGLGWKSELCAALLDLRRGTKLLSTYVRKLPTLADASSRIHTRLNQTGTRTGRLSSGGDGLVNMQNIAGYLKNVFVAPEGRVLVDGDMSQVEMRTLAHFVHDPQLDELLASGADTHVAVASLLFGVPVEAVDKKVRTAGKRLNFALLYGMGEPSLARELGCSIPEAHELTARYYARFPRVPTWKEEQEAKALTRGYVEYGVGRRRHFSPPQDKAQEAAIRRQAIDSIIQGTASEILQEVLVRLHGTFRAEREDGSLMFINTVHDSIVWESTPELVAGLVEVVRSTAAEVPRVVFGMETPFRMEVGVGTRWGEMMEI